MKKTNLKETEQSKTFTTHNGMKTNPTSYNNNVDLFFLIGALRNEAVTGGYDRINTLFSKAFNENPLLATKIAFWARDIRGGAGERETFRIILKHLTEQHPNVIINNLELIPFYGRWDDILVLLETKNLEIKNKVLNLIQDSLNDNNGLCAKWMPREKSKNWKYGKMISQHMGLTYEEYRKLIVKKTNVVEQQMCSQNWSKINYEHVPSLAMSRYLKIFQKHDKEGFDKYKNSLITGTAKINAGAIYPYDVLKSLKSKADENVIDEMWKALPNYLENTKGIPLLVCDVSSSMDCSVGKSKTLSCMDVCISLGLYCSERINGYFKDSFITFSENPQIQLLVGSLSERYRQLANAPWGGNTDLQKTFKYLLDEAILNEVRPEEMPTHIIILSDMEFDEATGNKYRYYYRGNQEKIEWNQTAIEMINKMYKESGYERPNIVFWNLHSTHNNIPVAFDSQGTALISGFSPEILKTVLESPENLSPEKMMLQAIEVERYQYLTI